MKPIKDLLFPLVSFAAMILLWYLIVKAGVLQELVMPSPWTVAKTFYRFLTEGEFFIHLWASFSRIITGFLIGAFLGVFLGILVGHFRLFERLFDPLIQALRPIPIAAWLPLAIVWFGIGDKTGDLSHHDRRLLSRLYQHRPRGEVYPADPDPCRPHARCDAPEASASLLFFRPALPNIFTGSESDWDWPGFASSSPNSLG